MKTLKDLHKLLEKQTGKKRMALAAANDHHALDAAYKAFKAGVVQPILVGDLKGINELAAKYNYDLTGIEIIDSPNANNAVEIAVKLVREGKAEILMKGNVSTGGLLKGVLNKEWGLRKGALLSHLAFFEIPAYHKLLAVTDVAMNIAPNLEAKMGILANSIEFMANLGMVNPKVAAICAVETVSEQMPATMEAAILSKMSQRGQLGKCIVDGPLAFDNAVSKESAQHKGIVSDVAGDADLLLLPDIEAGNVLYKALGFTGAQLAAVIIGATVPIVLTSRSDSEDAKFNSILLAAASCK